MYSESVCVSNTPNIYTDYYNSTPAYPPATHTESATSVFQAILEETTGGTGTPPPSNPADTVSKPESPGNYYVGNNYPVINGTAPKETSPAEPVTFNIGNYYSIKEEDVIARLREVRRDINNADLSGKSNTEKYDWIENQFIDAFGKDFMMARNLALPSSMFYMIGIEFSDTLNRHIEDPAQVNRERLYGDKSTEEIQDTIRDRFPDILTNRDLFLMVNEMRSSGVLDADSLRAIGAEGTNSIFDTLHLLRSYSKISTQNSDDEPGKLTLEERDRRWSSLLNMPISLNNLMRLYNAWSQDSRFSMGGDVASFIKNFLGGEKGENGLFIVSSGSNTLGASHEAGGPVHINIIGGHNYGTVMHYGDAYMTNNISLNTPPSSAGNGAGGNKNTAEPEEDWEKMLTMMLQGMDEYDDLIRSRMAMIDADDHPGVGEDGELGENLDAGEVPGAEEAPGAEENLDTEDAGEESGGESGGEESGE